MAFRTNKTPVLQEKTASGSVASFNTALAMPLASCNIAVNAWQEGSGDPSPSNVRAIHGFSEVNAYQRAVNLWDEEHEGGTINTSTDTDYHAYTGNTYTIQLGQEVYGAEVDVVNGVLTVTFSIIDLGDLTWSYLTSGAGTKYFGTTLQGAKMGPNNNGNPNGLCDRYKLYGLTSVNNLPNLSIEYGRSFTAGVDTAIIDDRYTDETTFNNDISGTYLMYELAEPFDIQLTPTQIETLIGNNTIFADTGDVDLTYNDLDIAKRGSFREVFKLP